MEIKIGLELECFIHNDTTTTLSELNIEYDLASCNTDMVTFYDISMVARYIDPKDSDKVYTEIVSGGNTFICLLDLETVKNKIRDATYL